MMQDVQEIDTAWRAPAPRAEEQDTPGRQASHEELLGQILEELRTTRRERQYEDFSIGRLAGAIVQAIALCAVGAGIYAWISADPDATAAAATSATIRLLAGIALQLLALTCFVAANRK